MPVVENVIEEEGQDPTFEIQNRDIVLVDDMIQ